ncbi:hypothetical protein Bhyg_17129, partial [Pseudolycoriella hygida]
MAMIVPISRICVEWSPLGGTAFASNCSTLIATISRLCVEWLPLGSTAFASSCSSVIVPISGILVEWLPHEWTIPRRQKMTRRNSLERRKVSRFA